MVESLIALSLVLSAQIALAQEPPVEAPRIVVQQSVIAEPIERIECFCVTFARQFVPHLPRGDAKYLVPNSDLKEGGVVILQYGKVRHVAVVLKVTGDELSIVEANYKRCRTSFRTINRYSEEVVGFWN